MPLDIRGFEVPETPYRVSDVPYRVTEMEMQKHRYDYQLQKEKEADQWKKLGLIQDLTDLSKHQTGSDVANAIGNQKATDVFQKYVAQAGTMSPNELAANIQKDMTGLVTSMDGIKTELTNADHQMAQIKQAYPDIDVANLTRDFRADVLNRHMKGANEFYNPLEIEPTQFDLSNPSFLGSYLKSTRKLDDAISNPKGLDPMTVASGDPYTNVQYQAKVPFWSQPNFDETKKKNGFLPKGFTPQLSPKFEDMPSDFLPALKNNPRKMVSADVHKQFYDEYPLEIEKGTRDMFGEHYDKMDAHEKEIAQRDFLATKISALDKNNFSYKTSETPSVSQQKYWTNPNGTAKSGGSGSGEPKVNDVYKVIFDWASSVTPGHGAALNQLPTDAQSVVLKFARDLTGDNALGQADIYVKKENDGSLTVKKAEDRSVIGKLEYTGTNIKQQPGVKEKREVVEKGKGQSAVAPHPAFKNVPKGGF